MNIWRNRDYFDPWTRGKMLATRHRKLIRDTTRFFERFFWTFPSYFQSWLSAVAGVPFFTSFWRNGLLKDRTNCQAAMTCEEASAAPLAWGVRHKRGRTPILFPLEFPYSALPEFADSVYYFSPTCHSRWIQGFLTIWSMLSMIYLFSYFSFCPLGVRLFFGTMCFSNSECRIIFWISLIKVN